MLQPTNDDACSVFTTVPTVPICRGSIHPDTTTTTTTNVSRTGLPRVQPYERADSSVSKRLLPPGWSPPRPSSLILNQPCPTPVAVMERRSQFSLFRHLYSILHTQTYKYHGDTDPLHPWIWVLGRSSCPDWGGGPALSKPPVQCTDHDEFSSPNSHFSRHSSLAQQRGCFSWQPGPWLAALSISESDLPNPATSTSASNTYG